MPKRFIIVFFLMVLFACEEENKQTDLAFQSKEEYEKMMILSHQEFLKKEKGKIQKFVEQSGLEFQQTGTGLNYHIYHSTNGDSIQSKEIAFITYCLTSIEGDTLYQSPAGKLQEFMVDYDAVETGLHEGIKKMKVGEKAYLILPAHLAHGITGDQAAIPSQTTLVYDIHLIAKR